AHSAFRAEVDRDALALYLRHNCVPAPYSIYKGIQKLAAGALLTVGSGESQLSKYWDSKDVAERCANHPFQGSEREAREALESILRDATQRQMISDVPLGGFLSGGIDSSTIVALMQAQSNRPVKSFAIGFTEPEYNEAHHAKAVAAHLGCDHTELYVEPELAQSLIPSLPDWFD